jgi:hypothetical protein|tara:strand:+ start:2366 stop:2551 length:186 start_codon:yes stop_codon:yes gene_type:complete
MDGGPKKTPPSVGPSHYTTFEDYWLEQDELWEISLKESKRQKEERLKKLNEQSVSDMPDKV